MNVSNMSKHIYTKTDTTIMAWDNRLDEIFEEMDFLLEPEQRSDVYGVLKRVRDLLKKMAEIVNDPA